MIPASNKQYQTAINGGIPDPARVRSSVWEIPQSMPGGSLAYSLCYVFRDNTGKLLVVDPGFNSEQNWATLEAGLMSFGLALSDVASVVATHMHPDHLGLAQRLRTATGAQLLMHETEFAVAAEHFSRGRSINALMEQLVVWAVPVSRYADVTYPQLEAGQLGNPQPDLLVRDGDLLPIHGGSLRVLHTPGHTSGHICLVDEARSLVLTGDLVLPITYPGLGLGGQTTTNPLTEYISSLEKIAVYDDFEVLPGHGYRYFGLAQRCKKSKDHHLRRSREVLAILTHSPDASVWEIASRVTWGGGWNQLRGIKLFTALAQTAMHREHLQISGQLKNISSFRKLDGQTTALSPSGSAF